MNAPTTAGMVPRLVVTRLETSLVRSDCSMENRVLIVCLWLLASNDLS